MRKRGSLSVVSILVAFCAAMAIASSAQVLTTLHIFAGADGAVPYAGLVQGRDGNFYGTTYYGGAYGDGTVFKITSNGTLTTLYTFAGADGSHPDAGLVQATDGDFYGTTPDGGANGGYGTVFKITPSGTLTMLYSFGFNDGAGPEAELVQATDGNFYGTTREGGASDNCFFGCGTVFKITPSGTLTTLYSFCAQNNCTDGAWPQGGLVQATDGNFYGTTSLGGSGNCTGFYGPGCGTVFKISPGGTLTTLYSFCSQAGCPDGALPEAGLVQATDGTFYGTTYGKGTYGYYSYGTVFKITPSGALTTLHTFDGSDGLLPNDGLVQASDGNFYGTTQYGGANNDGTVFKITASGTLTTLHSFDGADGAAPVAGLVQASDGNFYGTTPWAGGTGGDGTVFRLVLPRACIVCPSVE